MITEIDISNAAELYIAANGNDKGTGAMDSPLQSLYEASKRLKSGGFIRWQTGVYPPQRVATYAKNIVIEFENVTIHGGQQSAVEGCLYGGATAMHYHSLGQPIPPDVLATLLTRTITNTERQSACLSLTNTNQISFVPAADYTAARLEMVYGGRGLHAYMASNTTLRGALIHHMLDRGAGGVFEGLTLEDCEVNTCGAVNAYNRMKLLDAGSGPPAAVGGWYRIDATVGYIPSKLLRLINCTINGHNGGEGVGAFHVVDTFIQKCRFEDASMTAVVYAEQCGMVRIEDTTIVIRHLSTKKLNSDGAMRHAHAVLIAREGEKYPNNEVWVMLNGVRVFGGHHGVVAGWTEFVGGYDVTLNDCVIVGQDGAAVAQYGVNLSGTITAAGCTLDGQILEADTEHHFVDNGVRWIGIGTPAPLPVVTTRVIVAMDVVSTGDITYQFVDIMGNPLPPPAEVYPL